MKPDPRSDNPATPAPVFEPTYVPIPPPEIEAALRELVHVLLAWRERERRLRDSTGTLQSSTDIDA